MCMCSTPAAKDPSLGTPVLRLLETFSLEEVALRDDAAFAKPESWEELESRGVKYAIRILVN